MRLLHALDQFKVLLLTLTLCIAGSTCTTDRARDPLSNGWLLTHAPEVEESAANTLQDTEGRRLLR